MKVAVVGSQNVGKSTLIDDIVEAMPKFTKPTWTYRDAIKEAGVEDSINRKTNITSQKIIFDALASEVQHAGPYTILDRCVMDAVAYTMWPGWYGTEETDITEQAVQNMTKTAEEIMELYDLIVYIPVDESIEFEPDNFRDVDPDYRLQMSALFEQLLLIDGIHDPRFDKYGYKVVTIEGSREERVEQFKSYIAALA